MLMMCAQCLMLAHVALAEFEFVGLELEFGYVGLFGLGLLVAGWWSCIGIGARVFNDGDGDYLVMKCWN